MKKFLTPIIITGVVILLVALLIANSHVQRKRRLDERVSLHERDQIPYGTAAAKSFLPLMFPNAEIMSEDRAPGNWSTVQNTQSAQAVVLVSFNFSATEDEMNTLIEFARQGNYVYIIGARFSAAAERIFNFAGSEGYYQFLGDDSLRLKLEPPIFDSGPVYTYPGKRYDNYFSMVDSLHTRVLGRNSIGWPNFLGFSVGHGRIFVHSAPLAFSNYFILHKNNIKYFEGTLSVVPRSTQRLVWNEYYLNKRSTNEREPNMFAVLMRYPGLKWGLLLGLLLLIMILVFGSRRRQRKIIPHPKPNNDSLDFVKTLGRLYYDRNDHQNLARKMATYFLEHVRTTYRLSTQNLNNAFAEVLHQKSGYPLDRIRSILARVQGLELNEQVSESDLANFHQQLELFYQNT